PGSSPGCRLFVHPNKGTVFRLRPRENPQAQGYFMCDEGRFDVPYINSRERILRPVRRPTTAATADGSAASWEIVLAALGRELADVAHRNAGAVGFVLSPFLTWEEAYRVAKYAKELPPEVRRSLGWVPVLGEDDRYPKDRKGRPVEPVKFTIRAEKCPNRRGVEEMLKHFQGSVIGFDEVLRAAA